MKNFLKLIIILISICQSEFYSQTNSKGLSLKIKDLKKVEQNGKAQTSWTVKSILTNTSHDTIFYFIIKDCEPVNFVIIEISEKISLFADFERCDTAKQTVIALPPSGQRIVNLVISSQSPVTSPFKFLVLLSINKAKNINERIPYLKLGRKRDKKRYVLVRSNKINT